VPPESSNFVTLARLLRPQGRRGELLADLLTDFPEQLNNPAGVFLTPASASAPAPDAQRIAVESQWMPTGKNAGRIVLKFAGYDSIESATDLVGYEFGLPLTERVELAKNEFYDWELEGCLVESALGLTIGRVREVMRTGGVELLVVENEDREIFVPMVASIVTEIDISGKKILIDPPEGLLDL